MNGTIIALFFYMDKLIKFNHFTVASVIAVNKPAILFFPFFYWLIDAGVALNL